VKRALPYAPVVVATLGLAIYAIRGILLRCGHPAVPLDDSFIHFQYARRLATGHFFSFSEGDGYTSGATSFAWPFMLAPIYLIGFRDLAIIWGAWALGFLALGALAVETYRLALPLAGRGASLGAGAMVLCFGGYLWCAASGMEVVPTAWALAFGLRQSVEWGESPEQRTIKKRRVLLAAALLAPLVRPEGALVSLVVFGVLVRFPLANRRAPALVALVGPLVVPFVNLLFTGHPTSSTTIVKWLPGNPYYGHGAALVAAVRENVRLLFAVLLDGREWSAVYIPAGARPFAIAALVAIPVTGFLRRRELRAGLVLAMALAMLIPCTYLTFLWNRLRYLWPFAFAWFVGLACLSSCIAEIFASIRPRFRLVGGVVSGVFAGALASHLGWTFDDLWGSSSAIDRQQVALGRWADATLAPGARIGVNDTGAIGYLGHHKTFDVVGLTTPEEARYWVAGAGSRFEHYERLYRQSPDRFPTHFIVYPQWMACDAVLGDELHEETVTDQTILGGTTMTAFSARSDLLGSGDAPSGSAPGRLVDELDVADLESEAAHDYRVGSLTRETNDQAITYEVGDRTIADGTRTGRTRDDFVLRGRPMSRSVIVARFSADEAAELQVRVAGRTIGIANLVPGEWTEASFELPADLASAESRVEVVALRGTKFGSAHYWLYERP
jgi:hypothetical protein